LTSKRRKYLQKLRRKHLDQKVCTNHPKSPAAPGKTLCQYCLNYFKGVRAGHKAKGICIHCHIRPAVSGKIKCQECVDRQSIGRLPIEAHPAARKRAIETREARANGTYKCPVLGKTEKELNKLFPPKIKKSVWEFDHNGKKFRDIISRRANLAIGNLTSEQLLKGAAYVRKHEVR
jgi:hypothetical protein